MVVLKKRGRMPPRSDLLKRNSSLASIQTDDNNEKKRDFQRSNSLDNRRNERRVSFTEDFHHPPQVVPAPPPYDEKEARLCFYSVGFKTPKLS